MSDCKWISVLLTHENTEELTALTEERSRGVYTVVSYVVHKDYYIMSDSIGTSCTDMVVPSFELLPQIILLWNLGSSFDEIREFLNIPIREEDYV